MDAALRAGEYIPHLCHNPDFPPHGSCRVCVVDVNGRHQCSCTLPASDNLDVDNSSEAIVTKRRTLLQMLFVEGNHTCPACEKSGACQLQAVAYSTRMLSPHFTHFSPSDRLMHRIRTLSFISTVAFCAVCVCGSVEMLIRSLSSRSVDAVSIASWYLTRPVANSVTQNSRLTTGRRPFARWVQSCSNITVMRYRSVSVYTTTSPSTWWAT